jgi:plastocyanin
MKRHLALGILLAFLAGFALPATSLGGGVAQAATPQTYDILVGAESVALGLDVEAYFPSTVYVHVGDTVHWIQNAKEIHTVTFLAGTGAPPLIIAPTGLPQFNPAAINPKVPTGGLYDGATFANSGLMGPESWEQKQFKLTFTRMGTFTYSCLVHGTEMTGQVIVVASGVSIPSPALAKAQGSVQMAKGLGQFSSALAAGNAEAAKHPPVKNADGSTTYFVMLGYMTGQVDLMRFFPNILTVKPGDTVEWYFPTGGNAPHTVTFLNGAQAPDFVTLVPQSGAPPLAFLNLQFISPSQPGQPLTRKGVFSSGLMNPVPGTHYDLRIGNIIGTVNYECMIHDESGMTGMLLVVPK